MNDFFIEEDTNPEARAPLHPEVIEWATNMAASARHAKRPEEVIAGFDRLLELARGGR